MREEMSNLVYRVINNGLRLRERLDRGENPDFELEQTALKGDLGSEMESRRLADYGSDSGMESSIGAGMRAGEMSRRGETFLGVRYVLVCWLDELFVVDSPWADQWNERKLETAMYETNDRAWKFWDQARRAEARPGTDALEVFFLCTMLGFRGEWRDQPDKLRSWVTGIQNRIARSQAQEWKLDGIDPPINVPPRRARDRLQKVFMAGIGLFLVAVLMGSFTVFHALFK
jgi:type IV/VI secretion system ImpK/VasF family protein